MTHLFSHQEIHGFLYHFSNPIMLNPMLLNPLNSSNTCTGNNRCTTSVPLNPENSMDTSTPYSPVHFFNNSHLHEDELLLYSLMTLVFPLSTFTKAFEPSKYEVVTNIIHQITGIQYNTQGIRNYFDRVKNNKVKGIGKNKGICRWVYYQNCSLQLELMLAN